MSAPRADGDDLSTLLLPQFNPTPAPEASFEVVVLDGPAAQQRFRVDGSSSAPILVGQSEACDVRLADPNVSRRHATLDVVGGRLRVIDLQSRNGTSLDGVAILDAYAVGGETLLVGSTRLRIEKRGAVDGPELPASIEFGGVIGASREMRRLYPLLTKLAASDVAVLIEGETGTGKEIVAEALHANGRRARGPFVVFDCTAVPPSLVEAELFGHERGAFTGAVAARKGVFEQADGGTLLIDEIGDLDSALQPKLLRALERSEIRRVGGSAPIRCDVRILAATRRDLDQEVAAGRFRDDLFHRLAVTRVELPPLRRRRGDVSVLARHFFAAAGVAEADVPRALLARWERLPWPGNVRELRNAVSRHVALGELAEMERAAMQRPSSDTASTEDDPGGVIRGVWEARLPLVEARQRVVDAFDRWYLEKILAEHGGQVTKAAAAAGIARRYFQILRARHRG